MASTNPLRDITLTSPSEWDAWDDELRTKANSSDLWAHIDPTTDGKKLLERPTKPEASDFPKYIHQSRQETPTPTEQEGGRRRARTRGIQQTDTPEYPLTEEPARSMLDMSPEDQKTFQSLINIYNTDMRDYNIQMDRISALQAWISSTVARQYKDVCCKPDDSLRVWYKNLRERVKPNALQEHKAVWEEYDRAVKVLVRPPKDPRAWLRNWTVAVEKAAVHGIVTADKPWTWIVSFMKAVKHWKPSWESSYGAVYEEKIEAGTLSFRKVASDFEKELDKVEEEGRGRVAKGSFGPTFDGVRDDKDSTERKASSSRKRERATTIHQRCIVCERPTCKKLEACYYAFPEIAPKGGTPSACTQETANRNLKKNYVKEKLAEIRNKRARTAQESEKSNQDQ